MSTTYGGIRRPNLSMYGINLRSSSIGQRIKQTVKTQAFLTSIIIVIIVAITVVALGVGSWYMYKDVKAFDAKLILDNCPKCNGFNNSYHYGIL
jgi:hypothetical protein